MIARLKRDALRNCFMDHSRVLYIYIRAEPSDANADVYGDCVPFIRLVKKRFVARIPLPVSDHWVLSSH